ncbi:MAG: hypothetical protein RL846_06395, partial [Deltaproteobacteria bacterium]
MIGALLAALVAASPMTVEATVSEDLETVRVVTEHVVDADGAVHVFLDAERYRHPPEGLLPASETELFAGAFAPGGFEDVTITIDGAPCDAHAKDHFVRCPATGRVRVRVEAT